MNCGSDEAVAMFLQQVEAGRGDAEFGEYVSEVIEPMLLSKIACLIRGMRLLDGTKRYRVLEKLRHPLFLEEEQVKKALETALQKDDPLWSDLEEVWSQ